MLNCHDTDLLCHGSDFKSRTPTRACLADYFDVIWLALRNITEDLGTGNQQLGVSDEPIRDPLLRLAYEIEHI